MLLLAALTVLLCVIASEAISMAQETQRLYLITKNGKDGFINQKGQVVIQPKFDFAMPFSENAAAVMINDKWGFINEGGAIIVEPVYDEVGEFRNGLAPVMLGEKWGYIDKSGKMVIPPKFHFPVGDAVYLCYFNEGLAPALLGPEEDENWGYIDTRGHIVIPPSFGFACEFKEGLAAVWNEQGWGFIDRNGKYVVAHQFDYVKGFSEGLASVVKAGKAGYIDRSGKIAIPLQFQAAFAFHEGLAWVETDEGYRVINKEGQYAFQRSFKEFPELDSHHMLKFSEGMCVFFEGKGDSGKFGFIDKTGKTVIEPKFDYVDKFEGGLAWVVVGDKTGYIDKKGNYVWPPTK